MYVCVSIVVFIWACPAFCSVLLLPGSWTLTFKFFFFFPRKRKKEFFSDSKFPPSYPPTDTILFRTGDNFIHLHIIVSNSIGKLLQHASELDRTVMSSFPNSPYPQPPVRWDFLPPPFSGMKWTRLQKIISNKCFTTLLGHHRFSSLQTPQLDVISDCQTVLLRIVSR